MKELLTLEECREAGIVLQLILNQLRLEKDGEIHQDKQVCISLAGMNLPVITRACEKLLNNPTPSKNA